MKEIEDEFQAAIATARHALEQFNAEPLIASKRGGPRLSPWWRVWVQASEVGQRWHRQFDTSSARSRLTKSWTGSWGRRNETARGW
jgi:hypothetical protein